VAAIGFDNIVIVETADAVLVTHHDSTQDVEKIVELSRQMHQHRAEHWIVGKGTALVTKGDQHILLAENQSTYIPLGVTHRLLIPGKFRSN